MLELKITLRMSLLGPSASGRPRADPSCNTAGQRSESRGEAGNWEMRSPCFPQDSDMGCLQPQLLLTLLIAMLQCSEGAPSWHVSLPSSLKALKNSCVVLPCSFRAPPEARSPYTITWYLYRSVGYPEVFRSTAQASAQSDAQARWKLLGDPAQGECSLRLSPVLPSDADAYYVWINSEGGSHGFYDNTLKLTVEETPEPLQLHVPRELKEGVPATLTCSVQHTCPSDPPTLTWSGLGEAANVSHQPLRDGLWQLVSRLQLVPSASDNSRPVECMVLYPSGQQNWDRTNLRVKYLPRAAQVSIQGSGPLTEGGSVTLHCTCQSHPPARGFRWTQGPTRTSIPGAGDLDTVTLTGLLRDTGPYYCAGINELGVGEESAPLNLDLQYKPLLLPLGNCSAQPDGGLMCHCGARGNPDPSLEWLLPGVAHPVPGDYNDSAMSAVSSVWDGAVLGELWMLASPPGNVTCRALNLHGQSELQLPLLPLPPSGSERQLLMALGASGVGVLLVLVLMIVVCRWIRSRKHGAQSPLGLSLQRENQVGEKLSRSPSSVGIGNLIHMYHTQRGPGPPLSQKLAGEKFEFPGPDADYENFEVFVGGSQPNYLTEQIYSNM
ncbi:sialic acid-binding Ig-like lectin 5 isoform X1 [Ornithorhynchus anatinus]|uniref:Ig-like domain-containing protein n=1 Tax=Ornithorhynchus anatinus TaxID=9258 RepID=A0A6I8NG59_ORNAN|nr:sialic acid-binding Ig-like lectin 5 isoform X1 [Ornithorhynchus anatinus]